MRPGLTWVDMGWLGLGSVWAASGYMHRRSWRSPARTGVGDRGLGGTRRGGGGSGRVSSFFPRGKARKEEEGEEDEEGDAPVDHGLIGSCLLPLADVPHRQVPLYADLR